MNRGKPVWEKWDEGKKKKILAVHGWLPRKRSLRGSAGKLSNFLAKQTYTIKEKITYFFCSFSHSFLWTHFPITFLPHIYQIVIVIFLQKNLEKCNPNEFLVCSQNDLLF